MPGNGDAPEANPPHPDRRLNLVAGIAGLVILLALALLCVWLIRNFGLPLAG